MDGHLPSFSLPLNIITGGLTIGNQRTAIYPRHLCNSPHLVAPGARLIRTGTSITRLL